MSKLKHKGIALILVIFIIAILLLIGTTLVKIVFSSYTHTAYRLAKLKAFYLAEAALEYGKTEIVNNPDWYTDIKVTDPEKGIGKGLGVGKGKVVRARDENILYGIGYKGKTKAMIKITFDPVPFKQISWEEL